MKLKFILTMLLPTMRFAASLLRDKDANSTGLDDIAADQIDAAISTLEKYLLNPSGDSPLPV